MQDVAGADGRPYYNFAGSPQACAPLPLVAAKRIAEPKIRAGDWHTLHAVLASPTGRELVVRLDTDSSHIAYFFRLNWRPASHYARHDAHLIVRRAAASYYSLPDQYDAAILVDPQARCAAITGTEYYTKTKTSLRMLCSMLCGDDELFLHGCSVEINGVGVLICGYSGVGKTTLMRAMRDRSDVSLRVVNDDWSPLSLRDFSCRYTGEHNLHMKYPTVAAIAPQLDPGPDTFPSEYFAGDVQDPRARLMIGRDTLFPADGLRAPITIEQIWLLTRRDPRLPLSRTLGPDDANLFEGASPPEAEIHVEYVNGAFLLPEGPNRAAQHAGHRRMLASGRARLINNSGDPNEVAARLFKSLRPTGT